MASSLLKDFYNNALTKPTSSVMVPTTSGKPYVPNYTAPKTTTTAPKTTTPTTTAPKTTTGDWYDINNVPRPSGDIIKTALDTNTTPTPTPQQQIIYREPEFDPTEYINQLKAAQRQSRIAALDKAKGAALGSLDTEKANVAPTYYDKRNQAAAASDVGAMNFANYMAARGIKGAAGAMPEIYRNAGLQGQIGALDRQEAGNLAAIERQRANVESGYASDVAAANADVEAQAMQAAIDQYNQNRQYGLQEAGLTGSLGDSRTLAGQQFDYSKSPSNPAVQAQIYANKQRELEIAAQEIQNSFLPDTLKLQAQRLAQEVQAGTLDYDTALANLNQIRTQTANIGSTPASTLDNKTSVENYYALMQEFGKAQSKEQMIQLLSANRDQLSDADYRKALQWVDEQY